MKEYREEKGALWRIRRADIQDVSCIRQVVAASIRGSYDQCYCPEAVQMYLEHHSEQSIQEELTGHLLLLEGEALVGVGCLWEGEIKRIYILPEYQRRGYGSALLGALEERARQEGRNQVVLDASIPGRPLYHRRGYREISKEQVVGPGGGVLPYWRMEKTLR